MCRLGELDGGEPVPNEGEVFADVLALARAPAAFERIDWATRTIVDDVTSFETHLCALVDDTRDALIAGLLPTNEVRRYEYQSKLREAVNDAGKWPWLEIEAAQRGIDLETMRLLVIEASERTETFMARVSAVATTAKAAIRAATTIPAKQAACDAIQWPERPADQGALR